jgi:acetyl esterase/lipase
MTGLPSDPIRNLSGVASWIKLNRFGWESYLCGVARLEEAVPARAPDLTGLPRAWIGVGSMDLLFDEDLEYAKRLRQQGVPCALDIVPGAFHGFDLLAPNAGVSRQFFDSQCAALRKELTPRGGSNSL